MHGRGLEFIFVRYYITAQIWHAIPMGGPVPRFVRERSFPVT